MKLKPGFRCFPSGKCQRCALTACVAVLLLSSGCGSPNVQVFMDSEADFGYYERVGVVPFRTMVQDRFAGEKLTVEFVNALFSAQLFDVVDYGVFVNSMIEVIGSRVPADGLTAEQLQKIGAAAEVQGIFEGTVTHYDMMMSGNDRFPVISLEARLLDAETGRVVWSATITEKGGPKTPIIGIGEVRTLGELSQRVTKRLVGELAK